MTLEDELERAASALGPHVPREGATALAALLGVAQRALAEASALRGLPPPPPIGSDQHNAQRETIEDLRARAEVQRAQMGALIFEKGRLNAQNVQLSRRLAEAAEERARVVSALGEALRNATAEREARDGSPDAAMLQQMVSSQKRAIEGLRRELRAALLAAQPVTAPEAPIGATEVKAQQPPRTPTPVHLRRCPSPLAELRGGPIALGALVGQGSAPPQLTPPLSGRLPVPRRATDGDFSGRRRRGAEDEATYEQLSLSLLYLQTDHSSMSANLARTKKDLLEAQRDAAEVKAELAEERRRGARAKAEVGARVVELVARTHELELELAEALAKVEAALPPKSEDVVLLDIAAPPVTAAGGGFTGGRRRAPRGGRIWRLPLRWALWAIGPVATAAAGAAGRLNHRPRPRGRGDREATDGHALVSV